MALLMDEKEREFRKPCHEEAMHCDGQRVPCENGECKKNIYIMVKECKSKLKTVENQLIQLKMFSELD